MTANHDDDSSRATPSRPVDGSDAGRRRRRRHRRRRLVLRWLRPGSETLLLFLVAFAVRVLAWLARPAVLPDSVDLLLAADEVHAGGVAAVLHARHHPLPVALLGALPETWDAEFWGSLGAALLAALAVVPLHHLTRCAAGRHAATLACLLYAVLPKLVAVTSVPLAEGAFLLPFLAAFAAGSTAGIGRTPGRRTFRAVLAGMLAGLAYLARPEGLIAGLAVPAVAALRSRRAERGRAGVLALLGFVLVAAPWVAALSVDRGEFVLSPKKDALAFAGVGDAPLDASTDLGAAAVAAVRGLAESMWGALGPALLLAIGGALAKRRWRYHGTARVRTVLLASALALALLVGRLAAGWGYAADRHALSAAVLLLPFAGEGMWGLVGFLSRAVRRRRAAVLLATLLCMPLAVVAILRPGGESGDRERALGEQIAAVELRRPGGTVVIASFAEPLVAWYADRELRPHGRRARNLRLPRRRFGDLLAVSAELEGRRADLARELSAQGASWLVLPLWRERDTPAGPRPTGRDLARALLDDGVLTTPVEGSVEIAAFPVVR